MSDYVVDSADLTSVANAIRTKGGTSAQLTFPAGFVSAIGDIQGGGIGTALSNPPVKAVSGTITLSSAAYTMKILVDPNVIDVNMYQLNYAHVIMEDEYWADYEGNSSYNNWAAGQLLYYPAYYYETTISSVKTTEIFLASNANGHSWKTGGTFSRDFDNNGFNIQSAGNSYKFLAGVPYRYILVCFKIV